MECCASRAELFEQLSRAGSKDIAIDFAADTNKGHQSQELDSQAGEGLSPDGSMGYAELHELYRKLKYDSCMRPVGSDEMLRSQKEIDITLQNHQAQRQALQALESRGKTLVRSNPLKAMLGKIGLREGKHTFRVLEEQKNIVAKTESVLRRLVHNPAKSQAAKAAALSHDQRIAHAQRELPKLEPHYLKQKAQYEQMWQERQKEDLALSKDREQGRGLER